MSGAIFGKINLNNKLVSEEFGNIMMDKLSLYKLDSKKIFIKDNICMGCGLLHITYEDESEVLPYYDKENELIITADVVIDNREELINSLQLNNRKDIITDSQIVLHSYVKWKNNCTKYLIGDYSFVIWNEKDKEIFCARDHVGSRTLYYKLKDDSFSFSTVIEPIYENEEINERWLADFIAMPAVLHQSEGEETIYNNIYQIPAATVLIININGIQKIKYWDGVEDSRKLHFISDEECIKNFNKIFTEAIRCRLRTEHKIAISMSGGLDSTAVACVGAKILKEQSKNLISFTSIPMKTYVDDSKKDRIPDETEYVNLVKDRYDNIEINYCRSEGKDSLTDMYESIKIFEQPYKTYQNTFWYKEIMRRASNMKCKVLLTGQFGNYTISYGDFFTNMKTLLKNIEYFKFAKEIIDCSKFHSISILFTLSHVIKKLTPYKLKIKLKKSKVSNDIKYQNRSPINSSLISKWNIKKRLEEKGFVIHENEVNDMYYERKFMTSDSVFAQIGAIETKLSLFYGIIQRDPTKDKRIIEFCFGLGSNQYVNGGQDRYLIRRAMKGIIPEKIRLLEGIKGLQGADWKQRLNLRIDELYFLLNLCVNDDLCKKYLDIDEINNQIRKIKDNSSDTDIRTILMSINIYLFFRHMKEYGKVD